MGNDKKNNTVLGVSENVEALLCYVLGWLTGFIFLLVEKENKFVRFHAMQSLVVFLAIFIVNIVIGWIPVIGFLTIFIGLLALVLWILLMVKAYQGELYKLPYAGDFAEAQLGRMDNSDE